MEMNQEIRALSWKQPYASLMLAGKIETRTWNTSYRGLVLLCASKKEYTHCEGIDISGHLIDNIRNTWSSFNLKGTYVTGKAFAIGKLIDCRPMTVLDEEKTFVKYREGLFCHVYEEVSPIEPFEWRGYQGWKILDEETKLKIKLCTPKN